MDLTDDKRALDVIDRVYDTMVNYENWVGVSGAMKSLLNVEHVSITIQDFDSAHLTRVLSGDFTAESIAEFNALPSLPLFANVMRNFNEDEVFHPADLLPPSYATSADFQLLRDFFKRYNGIDDVHSMKCYFLRTHAAEGSMNAVASRAFDQGQRDAMATLSPHFRRAFRVQHNIADAYKFGRFALSALDHLNIGTFLLDEKSCVHYFNERAKAGIDANILSIRKDKLILKTYDDQQRLDAAIEQAINRTRLNFSSEQTSEFVIVRSSEHESPSIFMVLPFRQGLDAKDRVLPSAYGVVVFVLDKRREEPIRIEHLRNLFNLTQKEAVVFHALVNGDSASEIAKSLDVSIDAVNFHLKNLFRKTDSDGQTDLVSMYERTFGQILGDD